MTSQDWTAIPVAEPINNVLHPTTQSINNTSPHYTQIEIPILESETTFEESKIESTEELNNEDSNTFDEFESNINCIVWFSIFILILIISEIEVKSIIKVLEFIFQFILTIIAGFCAGVWIRIIIDILSERTWLRNIILLILLIISIIKINLRLDSMNI